MRFRSGTIIDALKSLPLLLAAFILPAIFFGTMEEKAVPQRVQLAVLSVILALNLFVMKFNSKYEAWIDDRERKWCFRTLLKKANRGDARSQIAVASAYKWGDGVQANAKLSAEWLERASDQGNSTAMFTLSECYARALGVDLDLKKSDRLLHLSAELGNADALITLGDKFANGDRVKRDKLKAYMWYSRGCMVGDWDATQKLIQLSASMTDFEITIAKRLFDEDH